MWVFGYGSLVWRPGIVWDARVPVRVEGWKRRFWQGSTDHRGVPGAPGRVVTMLEAPGEEVVGVAWRVPREAVPEVLERLDHREKGGYERLVLEVEPLGDVEGVPSGFGRALSWVATPENPEWLGPAPMGEMAAQIARSRGPSGPNDEYLLRLDDALRALGQEDGHVAALVEALRAHRAG
ncbi:MAG: gamma-glutamylcyclotransferase [Deltaproteobacteria bacterium]|nr:MAG: gamma-glutamylcyclotransferase [Deltaproteobacteria bacterium]